MLTNLVKFAPIESWETLGVKEAATFSFPTQYFPTKHVSNHKTTPLFTINISEDATLQTTLEAPFSHTCTKI